MKKNLNGLMIADDDGHPTRPLADPSVSVEAARVEAVFRNIPERLIALISQHPVVVGCVAWLTHHGILAALAQCDTVSIVVQKEDFLRPDSDDAARCKEGFVRGVRARYDALRGGSRYDFGNTLVSKLSVCGDPSIDPVRCVGVSAQGSRHIPRMHHKFIVLGRWKGIEAFHDWQCRAGEDDRGEAELPVFVPEVLWTGSFNFSANAGNSLENALIIRDQALAWAYVKEWEQLVALSEPLDWTSDWVEPEWRVGT